VDTHREEVITTLSNKQYNGYCKATEEEGDQRPKNTWKGDLKTEM